MANEKQDYGLSSQTFTASNNDEAPPPYSESIYPSTGYDHLKQHSSGQPSQSTVATPPPYIPATAPVSLYPRQTNIATPQPPPSYSSQSSRPPFQQNKPPLLGPNVSVVIPDAFSSLARFDSNAPVSVPPPPPGVAPNLAQIAAMHGASHQVILGQKKQDPCTIN